MAIPTPDTTLSANDRRILNALFDPETLPSSVASAKEKSAIDTTLLPHPTISSIELQTLEDRQNELVRKAASSDKDAIENVSNELDDIINQHPSYPSAYLNRAMLRRMQLEMASSGETQTLFDAPESEVEALFADLSKAIQLSLPSTSSAAASSYQARILRTAYSHRAYLYLKASENGVTWKGKGKTELEEQASRDFAAAAKYGDEVAREMSVRTNPYAKMCGAIVRNALAKEREGH
jgi:hypothetical protein